MTSQRQPHHVPFNPDPHPAHPPPSHVSGYLMSQVIFNIVGFACYWLPVQSGERVGLAITAMLSAVASDLVIVAKLPSASELTWLQKFGMFSQMYAAFSVLESVVVAYFFYMTSRSLAPSYLKRCFTCFGGRGVRAQHPTSRDQINLESSGDTLDSEPSPAVVNFAALQFKRTISMGPRAHIDNTRARDADDFTSSSERINNRMWKKVGSRIDEITRVVVPTSYVIVLSIFLAQLGKGSFETAA